MSHPGITFLDESPARSQTARRGRCCRGFNTFGILGSLFSILGVFTFGLASPFGLGLSLLGMLRRPRGSAWFGTVLGTLGTAFLALWGWGVVATIDAVQYENQAAQTQVVLEDAVAAINEFKYHNDKLPEGIQGNKMLISAELTDAWGTDLRYEPVNKNEFVVRSAGPDQKFETADDLTL